MLDILISNTFPGMKQHNFVSMNLLNAIDSIDSRVSMAVNISHFFDSGCFLLSDSLRGSNNLTALREDR